jgi:two-component system CheB/CheR fusion protein
MLHSPGEAQPHVGQDTGACDNVPDRDVLLSVLPDPCFVLDREGRFTYVNPAAEKFLEQVSGRAVGPILGRVVWQDYREVGESTLFKQCKQALDERISVQGETFYPSLKRYFATRICPAGDRVALFFRDVTDTTELRRELDRCEEKLAESERARSALLIPLVHEVRNVLSVSRNAIHLLGGRDRGQEASCASALAEREVCRLGRLLDDLLMISRLSTMSPRKQRINLSEIVGEAVAGLLSSGEIGGGAVTLQMAVEPLWLDADPAQMETVCQHLLGDAAQIGNQARPMRVLTEWEADDVVLRIHHQARGPASDTVHEGIEVSDHDDRVRLARETLHEGRKLSDDPENSGLIDWGRQVGLGLVRQIIELHGGSVEAQSKSSNRGSEFIVRLPAAEKLATELSPSEHRPTRVLVVDDNVQIAQSMMLILQDWGCQAQMVDNGAAALEVVRSQHPDLVILDLAMPEMDGYEVARRLRQEQACGRLTILALTGYSQGDERDRALRAGFDYYMVKPVDLGGLRALVQEVQTGE